MFSRRSIQNGLTPAKNGTENSTDRTDKLSPREAGSAGKMFRSLPDERLVPISAPAKSSRDDSQQTILWLRRADQLLLGVLLIALLILLIAFRWKLSGGGRTEIEIASQQPREYFYAIDVNNASWVEWAQLDGIGEKLAKRIVENRKSKGLRSNRLTTSDEYAASVLT